MIERHSASEIGKYGYAHYSGAPVTPGIHQLLLVPQSIADGWEGFCSCGDYRVFIPFYEIEGKDALLAAIRVKHAEHVEARNDPTL